MYLTSKENTEKIKFSNNAMFLGSLSTKTNCIKVWTITSKNYLYSFTDSSSIVDFIWNSNEDGFKWIIKMLNSVI